MRIWSLTIVALVACKSDFARRASKAIPAVRDAIEAGDYATAQRLCDENPVTGDDRRNDVNPARELDELCWAELPRRAGSATAGAPR